MNDEIKEVIEWLEDEDIYVEDYGYKYKRISLRETKILLDYITNLQQENIKLISENEAIKNIKYTVDEVIYKSRNDKAIEKLKNVRIYGLRSGKTLISALINDVLDILKGESDER